METKEIMLDILTSNLKETTKLRLIADFLKSEISTKPRAISQKRSLAIKEGIGKNTKRREARILHARAFEMKAAGTAPTEIAKQFNREGLRTMRKKRWTNSSVAIGIAIHKKRAGALRGNVSQ